MGIGVLVWTAMAVASAGSLVARRPWTTALSRRRNPKLVWDLPVFHETNMIMTAAWTVLFALGAVVSAVTPAWVSPVLGGVAFVLGEISHRVGQRFAAWRMRSSSDRSVATFRAILADAVRDKTDEEILAFVGSTGGTEQILDLTFGGMQTALEANKAQDCVIGYEVQNGSRVFMYRVEVSGTTVRSDQREPDDARATLVLSVPNYLRLITSQLDGMQAWASGRLKIKGDLMFATQIPAMFGA